MVGRTDVSVRAVGTGRAAGSRAAGAPAGIRDSGRPAGGAAVADNVAIDDAVVGSPPRCAAVSGDEAAARRLRRRASRLSRDRKSVV